MIAVVISQPMLFPWPGFFEQLALADVFVHLDDAQFSKGSFTNRIQLLFSEGRRWMTVPLERKGSFQRIDSLMAAGSDWKKSHRDMLCQSLNGGDFLRDAMDIFDEVYRHEKLCDLLMASIDVPATYLGLAPHRTIARSSELNVAGTGSRRVLDIVRRFEGNRYLTGHGAARYLTHDIFEAAGIDVEYMQYSLTSWPQPHGPSTPYVTILDLIARQGPASVNCLKPATLGWREFLELHRKTA